MGCCFCCLNEGDKVERVLYKFPSYPVSQAQDGALQKLVGRVVLAGSTPFYSPCENRPCVYFHVTVDEEVIRHRTRRDANGHDVRETYHDWQRIISEERFVDFYLQDGQFKLFVNGSNRGLCRIQGTRNAVHSNFFHAPPPGVQQLIWASNRNWRGWGYHNDRTGRFRYSEVTFDVNELVACLGVVTPAVDPYTRAPCKILSPVNEQALTEQFLQEQKWSDWDRRSWHDLCQRPAVLLSDNRAITGSVQVMPVVGLPQYMLVYIPTQVDMYGAGAGFQPFVPGGGMPGGMPGGGMPGGGMPGGGMPGGGMGGMPGGGMGGMPGGGMGGMPGGGMGGMPGGGMGGMPGGGMGGMPGGAPGGMPMGYSTGGDPSLGQGQGAYRGAPDRQPLLS